MEQSGARACVRAFRLQLKMHSPTVAEVVLTIVKKIAQAPAPSEPVKNRHRHRLPHGRGSVTLFKHATFFPNRERKRPVHLNFSRILTVAVR
jgi:hypothetical protein